MQFVASHLLFWIRAVSLTVVFLVGSALFIPIGLLAWPLRTSASWYGRTMNLAAQLLFGFRSVVLERERVRAAQPCVYVVNHRSNLDLFFLGCVYPPRTIIIAKRELAFVPIFGLLFVTLGNVLIDRKKRAKAVAGLDKAVELLRRRGESIWIFPEGTRNRTNDLMGPFKKGAFHMAIAAQVPIQPIVFGQVAHVFNFARRLIRPGTVPVMALEPIHTTGLTTADVDTLLERTRDVMTKGLEELERRVPAVERSRGHVRETAAP